MPKAPPQRIGQSSVFYRPNVPAPTLTFAGWHYGPVLSGQKTTTIRRWDKDKHDFDDGQIVRAVFLPHNGERECSTMLRITQGGTRVYRARNLPMRECQKDGYRTPQDAIAGLSKYYDGLTDDAFMAVINFEVALNVASESSAARVGNVTKLMRGYHLDFREGDIWLVREADKMGQPMTADNLISIRRWQYTRDRDAFCAFLDELLSEAVPA